MSISEINVFLNQQTEIEGVDKRRNSRISTSRHSRVILSEIIENHEAEELY
jgi:hypothetical protein